MECFQFLERGDLPFQYRLIFDRRRIFHITLPAPAFFEFQGKQRYFILREEAEEYERARKAACLNEAARQAVVDAIEFNMNYDFGYHPG